MPTLSTFMSRAISSLPGLAESLFLSAGARALTTVTVL